jgi:hypothetical protein
MKQVVVILLILGIITSLVVLAIAGYLYQKLQQKSDLRTQKPIIKQTSKEPISQETMIYSKEDLDTIQKKDKKTRTQETRTQETRSDVSGRFPKNIKDPTKEKNIPTSQNSSLPFVPKPAFLETPEEISQTLVLPKNHSISPPMESNERERKSKEKKRFSSLDNLDPPQEISGLGFNTAGLSPNRVHRSESISDDDNSEDDIDPEDSTNIIPK